MKFILATLLPSTLLAGTCGDISEDELIDFSGAGIENDLSNLRFEMSCGMQSSGAIAQDRESLGKGKFSKTICRIKCKNWDSQKDGEKKLFWVKTKARWKRTKYLQCQCNKKKDGEENCRYKRRGYNYEQEQGRSGMVPTLQIACDPPTCGNPMNIPSFNNGTVPIIYKEDSSTDALCNNCNINNNRGGTWKCFDKAGNELPAGADVPWRGSCKLTCDHNRSYDISKRLVCRWPHITEESLQWEPMWRLYKFLTLNKYKKNENMDGGDGWRCNSGLVDAEDDTEDDDE